MGTLHYPHAENQLPALQYIGFESLSSQMIKVKGKLVPHILTRT
jgi:hypothetical protein